MKILTTPFSLVAKIFGKKTNNLLPHEVEWDSFLNRLKREDSENVCAIIVRLAEVNKKVPTAVVVVGSTLDNKKAFYEDIDLLLLPLHVHNIGLAEVVFAEFARSQPETRKKPGTDEPEELADVYSATTSWYLDFGRDCVPIHLVIKDDDNDPSKTLGRKTFAEFLEWEREWWKTYGAEHQIQRPFSRYLFNED